MYKKYHSDKKKSLLLEGIEASLLLFPNEYIYTNVSTLQYILFEI